MPTHKIPLIICFPLTSLRPYPHYTLPIYIQKKITTLSYRENMPITLGKGQFTGRKIYKNKRNRNSKKYSLHVITKSFLMSNFISKEIRRNRGDNPYTRYCTTMNTRTWS